MAASCLIVGPVLGIAGASAGLSKNRALRLASRGYVEFIRNVPILLLTYFGYYGLPRLGVTFLDNLQSFLLARRKPPKETTLQPDAWGAREAD